MITLIWSVGMIVIMISGVALGITIERDKWVKSSKVTCKVTHVKVRGRVFRVREII